MSFRTPLALCALLSFCILGSLPMHAQGDGAYDAKFKSALNSVMNYRYGDISVFNIEGELFLQIQNLLNPPPNDSLKLEDRLREGNKGAIVDAVEAAITEELTSVDEINGFLGKDFSPSEVNSKEVQAYVQYKVELYRYNEDKFAKAYIVSTKYLRNGSDDDLAVIALILTKAGRSKHLENLGSVKNGVVLTRAELKKQAPPETEKIYSDQLYGFLKDQILQNNVTNVTLAIQGIDDVDTRFVRQVFGNAVGIPEDDVQQYMKITNGIPVSYVGPNELTISAADLISYRRYRPDPTTKLMKVMVMDSTGVESETEVEVTTYNSRLAQYGFEVRYGLEDINYPTLWSERMSLNAVWSQARLGVILPTSGWADLATSFGNARSMTSAGFGVNASLEVPIKIIAESGVFNFSGSYVFDDATGTDRKRKDSLLGTPFDFLVRFHANAQYTFAIRVDESNLFRFRLGGTGYSVERWFDKDTVTSEGDQTTVFRKFDSKFIGGVSGKIEFMNTSWSTPLGASLQYFDEAVLGNVWLQIQASSNLGFRLDVNMFTPVFRDPRAWENSAVFMPSLRAILNF